jgi:hypothetical protein
MPSGNTAGTRPNGNLRALPPKRFPHSDVSPTKATVSRGGERSLPRGDFRRIVEVVRESQMIPLWISADDESAGLGLATHGERAYDHG